MEHKEDKIIEEIREILMTYELPYEEGAWENFSREQETKLIEKQLISRKSLWKLVAVAAVILLLFLIKSLFKWDDFGKVKIDSAVVKTVEKEDPRQNKERIVLDEKVKKANINTKEPANDKEYTHSNISYLDKNKSIQEVTIIDDAYNGSLVAGNENGSFVITENASSDKSEIPRNVNAHTVPSFEPQGMLSFNEDHGDDTKKEGNWKFGVELSSSFIADNVNFGAGLITELKLSDKVSLATGVAFTKIDASNSIEPVGISASTKKVGVESSMQALDIPLSVVYQVNNGFYASIGVSALTVLNENKAYQYETQTISESYVTDPKTGFQSTKYSIVKEEYSEPTKETDLKGSSNIGYLNFSIGKKQSFYGKTQLLFEPFLKVPLGSLSNEEIRLTNGGLKIKLMF